MLRTLFVSVLAMAGVYFAAQDAFYALLLYLWVAYFRPESWMWDPSLVLALKLSFVSGAYLLLRAPGSGARFRLDTRSALLFALLCLSLISTLASRHIEYSWPYWIEFAKIIIITYILSALTDDLAKLRMVVLVIAYSVGFEAAKQGWARLILAPGMRNDNPFPVFGDNNGVAVGMLMLTVLFIALSQTAERRWERWLHRFFAVGVLYRGVTTYSRGGFLALLTLGTLYLLRSKHKVRSAVAATAVAAVIAVSLPQSFWDRMATIGLASEDTDISSTLYEAPTEFSIEREGDAISTRSRFHFWNVAVDMANGNPLGVGHNGFNVAYDDYDFLDGLYGRGRSVHSSWFGALAELGYLGLMLYVIIALLLLIGCAGVLRRVKRGELPEALGPYAVAFQNGFAVFIIGGSFVPMQYGEMVWHFVGLSMALRAIAMVPAAVPIAVVQAPKPAPGRFVPAPMMRSKLR